MAASRSGIASLKQALAEKSRKKANPSDQKFKKLFSEAKRKRGVVSVPDAELRYLEGKFDLPLRSIKGFWSKSAGSRKCKCGRVSNAFDIVMTAARRKIHDRETLRNTLMGKRNIFESAKDGRIGECANCGRRIKLESYFTNAYMYA
jgi:hypothetical protein